MSVVSEGLEILLEFVLFWWCWDWF